MTTTRTLPALLLASSILAAGTACGPSGPDAAAAAAEPPQTHRHTMAAPAADPPAGTSLWVLDQTWIDQEGHPMRLQDLAGRPRVVAMVYTHCTWACPRILARMKQIEAAFSDLPPGTGPGFVLVSIDPERDTPERLADFARDTRLDGRSWTLLSGPDDQVLELSVLLGVKIHRASSGELSHSNLITVVDAGGAPVARAEGLDSDPSPLVEALDRVVRGGAD